MEVISIKRLRKSKGFDQKTFAGELSITSVYMCAVEKDKQIPSIPLLDKIATLTNTQLVITFIDKEK